jgi:hypothetical protein
MALFANQIFVFRYDGIFPFEALRVHPQVKTLPFLGILELSQISNLATKPVPFRGFLSPTHRFTGPSIS